MIFTTRYHNDPRKPKRSFYHQKAIPMVWYTLLILGKMALLASCETHASEPTSTSKKIEKKVIEIAKQNNLPSLAVSLSIEGKEVNFDYHHKKVKSQSLYGIGSTSKLLSAVMVLRLVEEQKLSLEDELIKYIPSMDHVDRINGLTIKNLLNHTSGLPDYTKNPLWIESVTMDNAPNTFEEKIALVEGPATERGVFSYSNTNFLLLEKVVEAVMRKSFQEAFNGFYTDLGLTGITIGNKQAGLQAFYAETSNSSADVSHWKEYYGFDGGVYTTPVELTRALNKLFKEKGILAASTILQMKEWTPMQPSIPLGPGSITEYGYGIMKLNYNGKIYIGHYGGTLKYQSFAFFDEENKITISIVTNCSGRHYNNVFFQELVPGVLDEL